MIEAAMLAGGDVAVRGLTEPGAIEGRPRIADAVAGLAPPTGDLIDETLRSASCRPAAAIGVSTSSSFGIPQMAGISSLATSMAAP